MTAHLGETASKPRRLCGFCTSYVLSYPPHPDIHASSFSIVSATWAVSNRISQYFGGASFSVFPNYTYLSMENAPCVPTQLGALFLSHQPVALLHRKSNLSGSPGHPHGPWTIDREYSLIFTDNEQIGETPLIHAISDLPPL